jgi:hypothetical protein
MAQGELAGTRLYKVTIHGEIEQQKVQFGFHLRETGFVNTTSPGDVLPFLDTWTNSNLRTILATTARIVRAEVLNVQSKDFAQQEYTNRFGTVNEQALPSFVACLVSLRSPLRARYRNGRMYWFGLTEGATSGSVIQPTALATIQPVLDAFNAEYLDHALTKSFNVCVLATPRPANAYRPAITASWIDCTSTRLSANVTSMGTRRIGRGS